MSKYRKDWRIDPMGRFLDRMIDVGLLVVAVCVIGLVIVWVLNG